ncbi:hypothetical protein WOLCODRAFT_157253 [Wolfiporia cocos MD-104 SS10]|uniref:F-box domain-containing protein n=1 Tax=Wolfiporia cocos (strain MD-104) TaxID=742152 RepID=A0A2H3JFR9_WOLCO|nr:hypothetical protein WOLCODRAFT_157253 [Wolfiporia cocos MD-104 SS10]
MCVPTDIWAHILDMFKDQLEVMAVCGRVCMTWRAITKRYTRKNLDRYKTLRSPAEVLRFSQLRRAGTLHSIKSVTTLGSISDSRTNRSLAHAAAFPAMLAGNVPRMLVELKLEHGEWTAGIPRSVFLHLTTFTSISKSTLDDVAFPSIDVFDRLVCALSRLKHLHLSGVSFPDAEVPDPQNVFSHLATTITKLTLHCVTFPSFDRLVCALPRLEQLHLSDVSFSDTQAPAPLQKRWITPPNLHQISIYQSPVSPSHSDMLRALAVTKTVACCRHLVIYHDRGCKIPLDSIQDMSL